MDAESAGAACGAAEVGDANDDVEGAVNDDGIDADSATGVIAGVIGVAIGVSACSVGCAFNALICFCASCNLVCKIRFCSARLTVVLGPFEDVEALAVFALAVFDLGGADDRELKNFLFFRAALACGERLAMFSDVAARAIDAPTESEEDSEPAEANEPADSTDPNELNEPAVAAAGLSAVEPISLAAAVDAAEDAADEAAETAAAGALEEVLAPMLANKLFTLARLELAEAITGLCVIGVCVVAEAGSAIPLRARCVASSIF